MATVGIVSPGAMGSAVGNALLRGGARVIATVAGRSERTVALARRGELELVADVGAVIREADIVLSIVPPAEAESVAAELAGARLFADLNAISPARAARISPAVDGSISGGPPWQAGSTRIYLSGPRAQEVAALPFEGIEVVVVGDEAGLASAVKMSTASVYKGSAALLMQALRAAQHYGVLDHVLNDLGDLAANRGPEARPGGLEVGPLRRRDARDRRRAASRRPHARALRGNGGGLRRRGGDAPRPNGARGCGRRSRGGAAGAQ